MSTYAPDSRLVAEFERQFSEALTAYAPDGNVTMGGDTRVGIRAYAVDPNTGHVTLEPQRTFAINTYPTYPGGGPQVTVDSALQQPNIIARALTDLTYQRFVADRILARGSADQVRGGAAVFQRAESIFPDRVAETRQVRTQWPRTAWTVPDLFGSPVQDFGLETPIAVETRRRNAMDVLMRAQIKLGNAVVRAIDATAMTLIMNDPAVNTYTAASTWTGGTPNIIGDIASARNLVNNADLGYTVDTLIINPAQETSLLTSSTVANYLPRESTPRNPVVTGVVVPILGLQQVLVTNQIAAGKAIMCNANVVGSIADEPPLGAEGYTTYNPGAAQAPVQVKTYNVDNVDDIIIRVARFAAMWISEPRAAVYMQGL